MRNPEELATAERVGHPSAVVWVNGREALVTYIDDLGRISSRGVDRGYSTEQGFLADVISTIGDQERLMILGPTSARLALERAYVEIYHRPDRLVDVEPAAGADPDELASLVRTLAG
jgi:hypothetical protein